MPDSAGEPEIAQATAIASCLGTAMGFAFEMWRTPQSRGQQDTAKYLALPLGAGVLACSTVNVIRVGDQLAAVLPAAVGIVLGLLTVGLFPGARSLFRSGRWLRRLGFIALLIGAYALAAVICSALLFDTHSQLMTMYRAKPWSREEMIRSLFAIEMVGLLAGGLISTTLGYMLQLRRSATGLLVGRSDGSRA